MGKIAELFGKDSDIRRSDIERTFIENRLEESATLEYKTLGASPELSDSLRESAIVRPLISFLNGLEDRSALLVLGVRAKSHIPDKIVSISPDRCSADQVRQSITQHVGSLPSVRRFPMFRVVEVDCRDNEVVYLVELLSREPALYYSRITNQAFARRGDESYEVPLPEAFALAGSHARSRSQIRLTVKEVKPSETPAQQSILLDVHCRNDGQRPAAFVSGHLAFPPQESLVGVAAIGANFEDLSSINPGQFRVFSFNVNPGTGWPMYPDLNVLIGQIRIDVQVGKAVIFLAAVRDSDGSVEQSFRLDQQKVAEESQTRRLWGSQPPRV
ncbi:MAG TPA: hypothetical protein VEY12_05465 [Thermoplasmata archaeon]|nr:hypothetical protein [Thermoplasmata archaeon]